MAGGQVGNAEGDKGSESGTDEDPLPHVEDEHDGMAFCSKLMDDLFNSPYSNAKRQ